MSENKIYACILFLQARALESKYIFGHDFTPIYKLYFAAAEKNDPFAQYRVARILLNGENDIQKDAEKSMEFLKRSAEQGYPQAQNYLGRQYEYGNDALEPDENSPLACENYLLAGKVAYVEGHCNMARAQYYDRAGYKLPAWMA